MSRRMCLTQRTLAAVDRLEHLLSKIPPRFVLGVMEIAVALGIVVRPVEYVHTIQRFWGLHPYEQATITFTFGLVLLIAPVKKLAITYLSLPLFILVGFLIPYVIVHPTESLNRILFALGFMVVCLLLIIRSK